MITITIMIPRKTDPLARHFDRLVLERLRPTGATASVFPRRTLAA